MYMSTGMAFDDVFRRLDRIPYTRMMGIKGESLEKGRAVLSLEIDPERHIQGLGVVHGGVIVGLADSAAGWAALSIMEEPKPVATAELKVNYLRSVREGILRAEGRVVYKGSKLIVVEADVWNDDVLVAKALGTYYVIDRSSTANAEAKADRS